MKPTVGRIVHYYINDGGEKPLAAIITDVHSGHVSLHVLGKKGHGTEGVQACYSDDPQIGYWSWPPRAG